MNKIRSTADFQALVRESFDRLPPQQQSVASYLLDSIAEVPFLSIPQLAQKTGASEATIVRFAQSLGYPGFSRLKMELLETLRQRVVSREGELEDESRRQDERSLAAVARQEMLNLRRTLEELDREAFRKAAASLFKADHIFTFGLGFSCHFAELLVYLMAQIGLRASALSTRFSAPREQSGSLRPTDLLVCFSFPPYSRQTIDLLEDAAERSVPTLAICDRVTSPAARIAQQALTVRSDNVLFTNSSSALSMVLNALTTEIAVRHQDHAFEALSRINRILIDSRDLLEDSR